MSDNARFHNKLHRKNHHTLYTDGYPDSATDPIASQAEPFNGDFFLAGNLNVYGSINTSYVSLSNINIPVPFLSANVGFKPTNSLIIQLSGVKYAIPVTFVGDNTFNSSGSGINSLSAGITYLGNTYINGTLSGSDSDTWNNTTSTLLGNSASWFGGQIAFTTLTASSASWGSVYSSVCATSAAWQSATYSDSWVRANSATANNTYNTSIFSKLSTQAFTFISSTSSIITQPTNFNNIAYGNFVSILGGKNNTASAYANYSILAGGSANCTNGVYTSIIGGNTNTATGSASFIGGGSSNYTLGNYTGIIGGSTNTATGSASFIGGGTNNCTLGNYSGIIGGQNNYICSNASCSFIVGTSLTACQPNTIYVNNLNTQCCVIAPNACLNFLDVRTSGVGNTSLPNTIAQFYSNTSSYSQVNHQNIYTGVSASTDFIVTADNGNDTSNYLDLGINSSTYNTSAYGITGPNDAYLYAQSCNLAVGTAGSSSLILHTGGTLATNERVRITPNGFVGIGTPNPISFVTISSPLSTINSYPVLTVFGNVSASGCVYSSNIIPAIYQNINSTILPLSGGNTASGIYSYIGSGCSNSIVGQAAVIVGGYSNAVNNDFGSSLGGCDNTVGGIGSIIGGGVCNQTFSSYSSILGGLSSCASNKGSIVGGFANTATGLASFIGGGCNNTASSVYGIVVGGKNNTNNGINSFIAGGICNTINNSITGAFILGSNINASCSNQTYVNGLVADNSICGNNVYASNYLYGGCSCINTLSTFYTQSYQTTAWDITVLRSQNILGTLSVTGKTALSGNKYSAIIGDGTNSSFTINHKLSTSDIVMTVSNVSARQVVYPAIVITDSSNIQVSFTTIPPLTSYKVSIIGL
jgi:hypothetical protein